VSPLLLLLAPLACELAARFGAAPASSAATTAALSLSS
jgi:hypothetical protein